MAKDDYEAGLLGETAGHDTFSANYQAGAQASGYKGSASFVRENRTWADVLETTPYEPTSTQDSPPSS